MDYKFGLPLKKDGAFANLIVIAVSVLSGMFEKNKLFWNHKYEFSMIKINLIIISNLNGQHAKSETVCKQVKKELILPLQFLWEI